MPFLQQAPAKKDAGEPVTNTTLGPGAREGEHVFGVARILASFNDTFVCVARACCAAGPRAARARAGSRAASRGKP